MDTLSLPKLERVKTRLESSFVAITPEVMVMREALGNPAGAYLFPYELLQNAVDYNNDAQGFPSVVYFFEDGSQINAFDLTDTPPLPIAIEVRNYIKETGLDPYQIVDIAHIANGSTLGRHGRGGTVAATAALVDKHIESIAYRSRTKTPKGEEYSWEGNGSMQITNASLQRDPRFIVDAQSIDESVDQTVVRIANPDAAVVRGFRMLPRYFLPTNTRYEGCRIAGCENVPKIPALLTIHAGTTENGQSFSQAEIKEMLAYNKSLPGNGAIPRVEILPDSLIQRESGESGYIFEGGLKLDAAFKKYALNWSFYGFGDGNMQYGYNPSRSKDSSRLDGSIDNLMAVTLKHSETPEIFERILQDCLSAKDDWSVCEEGQIKPSIFTDLPDRTKSALITAWQNVSQTRGLTENFLITSDENIQKRLAKDGKSAVLVRSAAFVKELTTALGLEDAASAVGIRETVESTGERIIFTRKESAQHRKAAISNLLRFMSENNGSLPINTTNPTILTTRSDTASFQGRFGDLPLELRGFIENYLLSGGGGLRIKIADKVFELTAHEAIGQKKGVEINIERGTLTTEEIGVRIEFEATKRSEIQAQEQFLASLHQEIDPYMSPDGSINWDKKGVSADTRIEELEKQISALREIENAKARAAIKRAEREEPLRQRLSEFVRSLISWPRVARMGLASAILIAGSYGLVKGVSALGQHGVLIPGIELPSKFVTLPAVGKVTLPVESTELRQEGGVIVPNYIDRLPDSAESLFRLGEASSPTRFADILQLPAGFSGNDGEAIGYFPIEQYVDGKALVLANQNTQPFTGAIKSDSLDNVPIAAHADDLVYKPRNNYQSLYPPEGWKIVHIYQVGGEIPVENSEGSLFWKKPSEIPKQVIVVARKSNFDSLSGVSDRIHTYGEVSPFGEYIPNFNAAEAMSLNDQLAGDPKLQTMHKEFLQEMMIWKLNGGTDKTAAAKIAMKYLNQFAQWSDTKSYSLRFQIDKRIPKYAALISVSRDPNSKYFCSVASNVTADFLSSMGFKVANQPGYTLYNVHGSLYGDLAHQNNVIYLPDGTMIQTDNTPTLRDPSEWPSLPGGSGPVPLTDEQQKALDRLIANIRIGDPTSTSQESTSAVDIVTNVDQKTDILKEAGDIAINLGIPLTAAALSFFALRKFAPGLHRMEVKRRIEDSIIANRLSHHESRFVAAIANHLTGISTGKKQEFGEACQRIINCLAEYNPGTHGMALQWMTEGPDGIGTILGHDRLLSAEETFARVAIKYRADSAISERFPSSLRTHLSSLGAIFSEYANLSEDEFRAKVEEKPIYIPPDFKIIYDASRLILTQETGNPAGIADKTKIITDLMQTMLAQGKVGSSYRLFNALYQQLTGEQLFEVLERQKTGK